MVSSTCLFVVSRSATVRGNWVLKEYSLQSAWSDSYWRQVKDLDSFFSRYSSGTPIAGRWFPFSAKFSKLFIVSEPLQSGGSQEWTGLLKKEPVSMWTTGSDNSFASETPLPQGDPRLSVPRSPVVWIHCLQGWRSNLNAKVRSLPLIFPTDWMSKRFF